MSKFIVSFKSTDSGGVLYVNTLAVNADPVAPGAGDLDAQTVADDVNTWLGTEYRACLHPAYTLVSIATRGILGRDDVGEHTVNGAGTMSTTSFTGTAIPKELALIISWKTAHATRSGRGRMFLPSGRDSFLLQDASFWKNNTSYFINAGAFVTKVLAGRTVTHGIVDHHLSGQLYSRRHGVTYDLTSGIVRQQYHYLRSRSTAP